MRTVSEFNPSHFFTKATEWLNNYMNKYRLDSMVVGVSGGIDSAVVSTLCAKAPRPFDVKREIHLVTMPIHQSPEQTKRAEEHIKWLQQGLNKVVHTHLDLTPAFNSLVSTFSSLSGEQNKEQHELGLVNTRSRLRMIALYQVATANKGIVVGTGNKVEDFGIGFYTKYGDGGVDLSPIGSLTKTQVYQVAEYLGINKEIIGAPPTDGLWGDSRTDEQQIGASYPELEKAMLLVENINGGSMPSEKEIESVRAIALSMPINDRMKKVVNILMDRYKANQHKMNPIPVFDYPNA